MFENDSTLRNADESDDESDEYDVEEMNLHEIAHTDTPNKVKLEYILDEIQEDDDEDVATDGGVDMRQPEDDSHDVERGDEIVVDDVADSRQPMTVRVVYHSGGIKAIDQFKGVYKVSAGDVGNRVDVVDDADNGRTLNDYVDLGGLDRLQLEDDEDDDGELICDGGQVPLKSFESVRPETEIDVDVDSCEECGAPLTGVERFTTRFVTVDGRHLCPECNDARSGKEKGFISAEVKL